MATDAPLHNDDGDRGGGEHEGEGDAGRSDGPTATSGETAATGEERARPTPLVDRVDTEARERARQDVADARTAQQVAEVLRHRAIQESYDGGDPGPAFEIASVFDMLTFRWRDQDPEFQKVVRGLFAVLLRDDEPPTEPRAPRMPRVPSALPRSPRPRSATPTPPGGTD